MVTAFVADTPLGQGEHVGWVLRHITVSHRHRAAHEGTGEKNKTKNRIKEKGKEDG